MSAVALGELESGMELKEPDCRPGVGKVILSPSSPDLITGVIIQPFALWPDDRGYFLEVARTGQGLIGNFSGRFNTGLCSSKLSGHH